MVNLALKHLHFDNFDLLGMLGSPFAALGLAGAMGQYGLPGLGLPGLGFPYAATGALPQQAGDWAREIMGIRPILFFENNN